MKVRMLTDRAAWGMYHADGDIVNLPRDEALRLIHAGQAELVKGERQVETATVGPTETAAIDIQPKRKRQRRKISNG